MQTQKRTILITGATDGIGKETARVLGGMGCTILLHGRTQEKAAAAAAELTSQHATARIFPVYGDLSRPTEVVQIANQAAGCTSHIDTLLNNAGIYMKVFAVDDRGIELTAAVNHFSHFLLTGLLLPLLRQSREPRIVTVSSVAHTRGTFRYAHFREEAAFTPYGAYAFSKLCNVLFSNLLSNKLSGSGITSNCLHPGVISTKLLRSGFGISGASLSEGIKTSVLLAVSETVAGISGAYFSDCRTIPASPEAGNLEYQEALWAESERVCEFCY